RSLHTFPTRRSSDLLSAEIEHSQPEEHGNSDPAKTRDCRFAESDLMRVPVKDAQIQHDRDEYNGIEDDPLEWSAHDGSLPASGRSEEHTSELQSHLN